MSQGFTQPLPNPLPVSRGGTGVVVSTGTGSTVLNTSPTLVTPTLGAAIATSVRLTNAGLLDNNGISIATLNAVVSAVNNVQITNAVATGSPAIAAVGSDTNINLILNSKGTGGALVKGITSGNPVTAGYQGEIVTSQILAASATSILAATSTNLTSISLTAGLWLVTGAITFQASALTGLSQTNAWISSTSAALPDLSLRSGIGANFSFGVCSQVALPIIFNLSATTDIYITGNISLNSGTCTQCGFIRAHRIG